MRMATSSLWLVAVLVAGLAGLGVARSEAPPGRSATAPVRPTLELALGHSDRIQAIAWRKDGDALATASRDGSAILWNPRTGMPWATLPLESSWRNDVSWSPDG